MRSLAILIAVLLASTAAPKPKILENAEPYSNKRQEPSVFYQRKVPVEKLDFIDSSDPNDLFVVLFLGTDCPISQKYMHTLRALHRQYKGKISFFGLFPKNFNEKQITTFQSEYDVPFEVMSDTENYTAHLLRATITPEVFFFNSKGDLFYDGAIDDWFFALGRNRIQPKEHYLKDAIDHVLAGLPVTIAHEDAIGCLIEMKH